MMNRIAKIAGSLSLVVLAGAGCGGGGDKALSKAEFVKQGNAACQRYHDATQKIGDPQSLDDIARMTPKVQAEFNKMVAELKGIKPPSDLNADYDKLLAAAETAKGTLADLKSAAAAKDVAKITALGKTAASQTKEKNAVANRLGLTACAQT
jgi:hypothetical protein